MDPHEQFCHNPDCPNRGQGGRGNIRIPSCKRDYTRALAAMAQVEDLTVLEEAGSSSG
jgi:hypothetical protein